MSATSPNPEAGDHARLGALVRERREAQGLSMDNLATRARVSRSTVHRLEHGAPFKPMPSKLARILAIVGIDADDLSAAMPNDVEYRGDLVHWLDRVGEVEDLAEVAKQRSSTPDLIAFHPDGTVARIQADSRHDELGHALKGAGWTVTRPV